MQINFSLSKYFLVPLIILALSSCKQTSRYEKTTHYRTKQTKLKEENPVVAQTSFFRKNPKTLSLEELQVAKNYAASQDNTAQVAIYLENMIKKCSDPVMLQNLTLELADIYFEQGKIENASKLYTVYLDHYPGSPERAYVHYQALLCKYYSTFSFDRDQTKTQEAFKLAQKYLDETKDPNGLYVAYADDVRSIQKECCKKMYDHEMDVVNFYYKKGNYKAAQLHVAQMKKDYLKLMNYVEPDLLALECQLAQKLGDDQTVIDRKTELTSKYPEVASIKLAQNRIDHVTRF